MLAAVIHESVIMFSNPGLLKEVVDVKSFLRVIMLLPVLLSVQEIVRQNDRIFQHS